MTRHRYTRRKHLAVVLLCVLFSFGCTPEPEHSSLVGGYTFSRDFDGERRVLQIDRSTEVPVECMRTSLPARVDAVWKETFLEPGLQTSLIDLLSDEARVPQYEADTRALLSNETFICTPQPGQADFCYVAQLAVAGIEAPWRFGLQAGTALSDESQELLDRFLVAHDACWNSDRPSGEAD